MQNHMEVELCNARLGVVWQIGRCGGGSHNVFLLSKRGIDAQYCVLQPMVVILMTL